MRLLLDTHALIWWLAGDERLPQSARVAIRDADLVYVSAASAWEIATKARIGKLPEALGFAQELRDRLDRQRFRALDISLEHAQRAGFLPGPHRDPFDRMLIAQAQAENLILVSNEGLFDDYGVVRLWK